jgi:hypothetical protein
MTLVVLGHNFEKGFSWGSEDAGMVPNGLFAASDSAITSNGATLLGGFRKVYSVPIKIWKPYFLGQDFHSYRDVHHESECFIAISGSTLTAQHVLNSISEHLSKLRISYERPESYGQPGRYIVIRHCQKNILHEDGTQWSEYTFTPNDFIDIENAEAVAVNIEYSINEALKSARKYKLDENSLIAMYSEFAAGVYCPVTQKHKLYTYRMDKKKNSEGVYEVFAEKEEVQTGNISVLGMRQRFEEEAQQIFNEALQSGSEPSIAIFRFLNKAIDEVRGSGGQDIDRPSVLKHFNRGKVSNVEFLP